MPCLRTNPNENLMFRIMSLTSKKSEAEAGWKPTYTLFDGLKEMKNLLDRRS